jgi:hypothetical protein
MADKLKAIKELIDNLTIAELFESDDDLIDISNTPLTPLGKFCIRLESVINRDEDFVDRLRELIK